jgi:hypothetical protein
VREDRGDRPAHRSRRPLVQSRRPPSRLRIARNMLSRSR